MPQIRMHAAQAGLVGEQQRQHCLQAQQAKAPKPRGHMGAARPAHRPHLITS